MELESLYAIIEKRGEKCLAGIKNFNLKFSMDCTFHIESLLECLLNNHGFFVEININVFQELEQECSI